MEFCIGFGGVVETKAEGMEIGVGVVDLDVGLMGLGFVLVFNCKSFEV